MLEKLSKNKLTIEVAIPVYNEERTISYCIQSIIQNKLPNYISSLKIIVYDDGSTDNTPKIIQSSCMDSHNFITYIRSNINRGKYYALNELFRISLADILILLDSDVELTSHAIERLSFPFVNREDVSLVSGLVKVKPKRRRPTFLERAYSFSSSLIDAVSSHVTTHLATAQVLCLPAKIYKQLRLPATSRVDFYIFLYCFQRGRVYVARDIGYTSAPTNFFTSLKKSLRVTSMPNAIRDRFPESKSFLSIAYREGFLVFPKVFVKSPFNGMCWLFYKAIVQVYKFVNMLKGSQSMNFVKWKVIESGKA